MHDRIDAVRDGQPGQWSGSRPAAREVDGENWAVVRPRPTYEEMLDREPFADWL